MSKTLEEIQAEIAATAQALASQPEEANVRAVDLGTTLNETGQVNTLAVSAAETVQPSVGELLQQLSAATGIGIDQLLQGLDKATGGTGEDAIILPEGTKTYYTNIPNSGIMVQVGPAQCERVEFKGDTLHTTDPAVIAYLDAIVDKPGSGIYSRSHRHVSQEVQQMRDELNSMARQHHAKMLAAGEKTA